MVIGLLPLLLGDRLEGRDPGIIHAIGAGDLETGDRSSGDWRLERRRLRKGLAESMGRIAEKSIVFVGWSSLDLTVEYGSTVGRMEEDLHGYSDYSSIILPAPSYSHEIHPLHVPCVN